ncbi:glycosyltransferase [Rossellomorea aquimaris]|uniref:glycosyltransferase n=1 Tax=Rossellomorea aquimaris TaxID=189382 RepID=UPI001CFDCD94|nr:glycosyltransferase [Rossellomorea aquimaris]
MIRILHYGLSSNRGGIETYLNKLWNNIDRSTFKFDFIDTNIEKPCFYDEFKGLGSNFYKITHRNISISKNKRDLENLFKQESFDILHCHLNTLSYIEPVLIALNHGCEVIVHSRSSGASNSLVTNLLHYYHSIVLPKNKIKKVAVSNLAGKWLFGKTTNFQTINNGVDINKFKFNSDNRERLRRELNIEDKFVVGNVGAFLPAKNHGFILKIFKELIQIKPEAILLLIGTGPLKKEVQNLVYEMNLQEKVYFLGIREDIPELLSAMDFFLFPSIFEGFPNAVLEAQTSGLPCLISDVITDEVVLSKECIRLPLNLPTENWVNNILNFNMFSNRDQGSIAVEQTGYSVKDEIKKVEKLYYSVLF